LWGEDPGAKGGGKRDIFPEKSGNFGEMGGLFLKKDPWVKTA